MTNFVPRPQSHFFYSDKWPKEIDDYLIEFLATENYYENGIFTYGVSHVVRKARDEVNVFFRSSFSTKEIMARVERLKRRHALFSHLRNLSGYSLDPITNTVGRDGLEIVKNLCMEAPFYEAYAVNGEPKWNDLCEIFGYPNEFPVGPPPASPINLQWFELNDEPIVEQETPIPDPINPPQITFSPDANDNFWNDLASYNNTEAESENDETKP